MTRVLHYGMGSGQGGIETYLYSLAMGTEPREFELNFLYSDEGRQPFYASQLSDRGSRFFGVTPRGVNPLANRRELRRLFREHRFDLLQLHVNTASYLAPARAALAAGVPVIVHSHNAGASRSRKTVMLHHANRWLFPWSRVHRIAVSGLAGTWMFGKRPFEVVPNGIDAEALSFDPTARQALRQELGIRDDDLVLGHIGAFLPAKNHRFVLDVFDQVRKQEPRAHLLLVGDGPLLDEVRHRAQHSPCADAIQVLGRRDDITALMSAMDRFVFPSLHEGFGLVVLEAQASGLPAVVSTAVPHEVALSQSCRRRPIDTATEWAEAILELEPVDRTAGPGLVRAAGFTTAANTHRLQELWRAHARPA